MLVSTKRVARYTNEIPGEEELTQMLRRTCAGLLETYLPKANKHVAEKFIKTYAEPLYYLWKIRLRQNDVDQESLKKWRVIGGDDIAVRQERAREAWKADVRRQVRHYHTWLPHVTL